MRVLVLSPYPERLSFDGDDVIATDGPVTLDYIRKHRVEFIVSYGYLHMLKPPVLGAVPAINLHISYLPFGRGKDPNLWAWLDGEPHGVTIHWIDEGLDTGPILAQQIVEMGRDETLATSYWKKREAIEALFRECWPEIRDRQPKGTPQSTNTGSLHYAREKTAIETLLSDGWDTPVRRLTRKSDADRPATTRSVPPGS